MQISLFRLFIAGVVEKDVSTTLNVTRGHTKTGWIQFNAYLYRGFLEKYAQKPRFSSRFYLVKTADGGAGDVSMAIV